MRGSTTGAAAFFSAFARAASCAYSADETAVASLRWYSVGTPCVWFGMGALVIGSSMPAVSLTGTSVTSEAGPGLAGAFAAVVAVSVGLFTSLGGLWPWMSDPSANEAMSRTVPPTPISR